MQMSEGAHSSCSTDHFGGAFRLGVNKKKAGIKRAAKPPRRQLLDNSGKSHSLIKNPSAFEIHETPNLSVPPAQIVV